MSHKTLARIAVVMVIVFGGMVLAYPLLFNSEPKQQAAPVAEPPTPPAVLNHK